MTLRQRWYNYLETPEIDDGWELIITISLLVLIVLNIAAVALETIDGVYSKNPVFFDTLELVSICVFGAEYLIRIWVCVENPKYKKKWFKEKPIFWRLKFILSPFAILDLLAIGPFFLPILALDLRFIRSLRLIRILRIGKLGRYSVVFNVFGRVFFKKRYELFGAALLLSVLMICASSLMYFAENDVQPEVFTSIPAVMWHGITHVFSLGKSDARPMTNFGNAVMSASFVLGAAITAIPTGVLTAGFIYELKSQDESAGKCSECSRLVAEDEVA